ncbi:MULTISPECIES: O-antigen ligase family protein [unclassified Bacillus (in: firmicutes)]|uniref:O-antigen ligase family protein n=1 Tax=unclassified Bacillus (in: firmicutes) TaxID=185979 RepID=UPI0008E0071E|nr:MULTISPECIES: O-antigen ligase family protein [unclassified Bacillus (in: firmicutes)]SFJ51093.1 O-antigen ligase like membrane protein [Bacillus sp. 71mf]SFT04870.1 O-antigen ligase like membrane protein [Bacillus sp. 103mf]
MLENNSLSNKFENFLLIFIMLQPILDLLTSFCIMVLKIDTTIGVITRLFVMALGGIYILLQAREKENRKYIIYLIVVGIVCAAGFVNNKFVKSPIILGEEIKFIAKSLYPLIMLTCYIFVFKSLKNKINTYSKMRIYIVYSTLIINAIMVISIATGTDYNSYTSMKIGSRGWFYAGNELGSILAVVCPIVVLYSIEKTTSIAKSYFWIPSLLMILSLFSIGTKVGVGAIFGTIIVAVFMCYVQAFLQRKDRKKKPYLLNGIIATVVFAGVLAYTPFSPFLKNMGFHFQFLENKQEMKEAEEKKEGKQHHKPPVTQEEKEIKKKEETQALIFSGREVFEKTYKDYYTEAPTPQKLLGMGYAGNFKENPGPKLIERDFHDWFYAFGIIGFALLLIPFLYFGVKILFVLITRFREVFTVKYGLLATSLALSLGIAFIAGHVLTAPGVSIYFVVIFAYLIVDLEIE